MDTLIPKNYPQQFKEILADLLFPSKCINCAKYVPKKYGYICKKCLLLVKIRTDFECIGCKTKTTLGKTCNQCANMFYVDDLLVVSFYREPLIKLVKLFKYKFIKDISLSLNKIMSKYITWLDSKNYRILSYTPIIIPVPIYFRRLNWRGFNQSELIAKILSDKIQCHLYTNILIKKINTKPQAIIEYLPERHENQNKSFEINPQQIDKIKDKNIILVDDICTTGSTLNECAKLLKQNGVSKVIGFVIARG